MDGSEDAVKVLLTGSEGFVGTYFKRALAQRGITPVCVDIAGSQPTDARDFFRADTTQYDLVIHLAAVVGGRAKIDGAPLDIAVDLAIDAELFQFVMRTAPKCTMYFSSSAAYPIALQGRGPMWNTPARLSEWMIKLDDKVEADMTYGHTKLTGEYQAEFARAAGHRVLVFRPFGGYGPEQTLDYPWTSIAKRAVCMHHPLEVWGPGDQRRDFIHMSDVVDGALAAYDAGLGGTYNLCTGGSTSFIQLASLFAKVVAVETGARYTPLIRPLVDKPSGVHQRVGDPRLMSTFYSPKITLLEGVQETVRSLL